MGASYTNLPVNNSSINATVQAFDTYYSKPLELDAGVYTAMVSFFTGRGFDKEPAGSISAVIIKQARIDGYNPLKILDTLKGLDNVEISALVSEIINYNRFKTSFLGYALAFNPNQQVLRNIQA
jgi:hypothetical protein